jgi:hypothetical protein
MPSSSRSRAPTFCCWAMSGACAVSWWTIALAPSGGSGESHACSAAITRSAGRSASAAPPLPCPSSSDTDGTDRRDMSARQRAISPASAPSSARGERSAPGVSITATSGRRSSSASRMPRRASRSAVGPSGRSGVWCRRSCPIRTHGSPSNAVRASSSPASRWPSPVPLSGMTSSAPRRSRSRTPGRSGRRVSSTDSHVDRVRRGGGPGSGAGGGGCSAAWGVSSRSTRRATPARSSGATTPSMTPFATRFSATCTPLGNGLPVSASITRGPRKPMSAPGSATVTCPRDPHDAKTPPVVGLRR